jgi:hypothetical protein
MLSYFILLYFILLAISLVIIYQRKTFNPAQKRVHAIISLIFPLWGILIKQFSDKPVRGSHFYPDKRNKYTANTEYNRFNTDAAMMNSDDSHSGADV